MKIDATYVTPVLSRGLVKRVLREGRDNSAETLCSRQYQDIHNGKQNRQAAYNRLRDLVRKALGHFLIDEFSITRVVRGQRREVAYVFIGFDTAHYEDGESCIPLLMVKIGRSKVDVDPIPVGVTLSTHILERSVERERITDMSMLAAYLRVPSWQGVHVHFSDAVPDGRYYVMGDEGFSIMEKEAGWVTGITWVPRRLWRFPQSKFYSIHSRPDAACVITASPLAGDKEVPTRVHTLPEIALLRQHSRYVEYGGGDANSHY